MSPEPDLAADLDAAEDIESRRSQQFNCSDPPEESCSDAACPVHADGDDPDWGEDTEDWP